MKIGCNNRFYMFDLYFQTDVNFSRLHDSKSFNDCYNLKSICSVYTDRDYKPVAQNRFLTCKVEDKVLFENIHSYYHDILSTHHLNDILQTIKNNKRVYVETDQNITEYYHHLVLIQMDARDYQEEQLTKPSSQGKNNREIMFTLTRNRNVDNNTVSDGYYLKRIQVIELDQYNVPLTIPNMVSRIMVKINDLPITENFIHGAFFHPTSFVTQRPIYNRLPKINSISVEGQNLSNTTKVLLTFDSFDWI